jgi:hypothetical protein
MTTTSGDTAFTLKVPRASVIQGLTLLGVLVTGGAWAVDNATETGSFETIAVALKDNSERLRKLEHTLAEELDRRRAADAAEARQLQQMQATLDAHEFQIGILVACAKQPRKCPL